MTDFWLNMWQQLSASSWMAGLSLLGYITGLWVYRRFHQQVLVHPLITAIPLIFVLIYLFDIDYEQYYQGNGVLNWLLGPATVALAFPLSRQVSQLSGLLRLLTISLLLGGLFAAFSAISLAWAFGVDDVMLLSLAAKSVTTPIAIGLTEQMGGLVTVVSVAVLLTGIIGVMASQFVFNLTKLTDERMQGLVLGIAAHAIGTAKAFEISAKCGAFSTLGMGITGIWTSLFLPWVIQAFLQH